MFPSKYVLMVTHDQEIASAQPFGWLLFWYYHF